MNVSKLSSSTRNVSTNTEHKIDRFKKHKNIKYDCGWTLWPSAIYSLWKLCANTGARTLVSTMRWLTQWAQTEPAHSHSVAAVRLAPLVSLSPTTHQPSTHQPSSNHQPSINHQPTINHPPTIHHPPTICPDRCHQSTALWFNPKKTCVFRAAAVAG